MAEGCLLPFPTDASKSQISKRKQGSRGQGATVPGGDATQQQEPTTPENGSPGQQPAGSRDEPEETMRLPIPTSAAATEKVSAERTNGADAVLSNLAAPTPGDADDARLSAPANQGCISLAHTSSSAHPEVDGAALGAVTYDEFEPLPLAQNTGRRSLHFDTFDAALDEFFAKVWLHKHLVVASSWKDKYCNIVLSCLVARGLADLGSNVHCSR